MQLAILGASGRMGQALIREVAVHPDAALAAAADRPGSPVIGKDAGVVAGIDRQEVTIGDDLDAALAGADAVIDFTAPDYTAEVAAAAARHGAAHISGTTGLEERHREALRAAAAHIPVIWAPNMSLGVNLLLQLAEYAARRLDARYDAEIVEMHHRHKVDAPSGTALALGQAVASGRGVALDAVRRDGRSGQTGARPAGEIGFAVLRGGDVVGEHTVLFAADGERFELTHKATDRAIFARGAVYAALWTPGKPPGLYSMQDVLGTIG